MMVEKKTETIRRYGFMMKWVIGLLAAASAGSACYALILWATAPGALDELVRTYVVSGRFPTTLTDASRVGLALLGVANLALLGAGLYAAWKLADAFCGSELDWEHTGINLRRTGFYALAGAIVSPLSRTVAISLATLGNPPGQRMLSIGFGTNEAFMLLAATILVLMGHVMMLANALDRENREFV